MSNPPLYARNYIFTAQKVSLARQAGIAGFRPGQTGKSLAQIIKTTPVYLQTFDNNIAEVDAFAADHEVVAAISPSTENGYGSDILVLRDKRPGGGIQFLVYGVNDGLNGSGVGELQQTGRGTIIDGFNAHIYADVKQVYQSVLAQYPTANYDLAGFSLGGQMVQMLAAQFALDGHQSLVQTVTTFGSFGVNFNALWNPGNSATNIALLTKLGQIEHQVGFMHFANAHDVVALQANTLLGNRVAGYYFNPLLIDGYSIAGTPAHDILVYKNTLGADNNNVDPIVMDSLARRAFVDSLPDLVKLPAAFILNNANIIPQTDGTTQVVLPAARRGQLSGLTTYIDPATGATVPQDIGVTIARGQPIYTDRLGEETRLIVSKNAQGKNYVSATISGSPDLEVVRSFSPSGALLSTDLNGRTFAGVDFANAGDIIGSILGYRLAGGNQLTGVVYSAALKTLGDNLGDTLDRLVGGKSLKDSLEGGFEAVGGEFFANLKSAGLGAVSSFVTAELVKAIGLDGFAGELANSAGGAVIGQVVSNLASLAGGAKLAADGSKLTAFSGVNPIMIGTAVGSFLGTKLASEIVSFESVGGQIGSAVGAALGVIAAEKLGLFGAIVGGPVGAVIGAAIGAFVGFIVGGMIGSIFGGTPRSGADSQWDEAQQKFVVANVYARKGGSKEAASSVASAVSETFNSVLAAAGGTLLDPQAVQSGNYGMRKKDFVYRPLSTRDASAITQRFSGKNAAQQLIGYGIYQGLTDPDFKIAGGDAYVKRALYNSFSIGGIDPRNFDTSILLGNISAAQQYESYLANANVINALVSAEPDSVFAIETLLTLARADELGLTRRAASDWFGGFSFLIQEAQTNAAMVGFGFDYDFASGQVSRLIALGDYTLGDPIDVAGQTEIVGTAAADVIDLRSGSLANQIGYTVGGHLNDDIALGTADFAVKFGRLALMSGSRSRTISVATVADGIVEADESFAVALSDGVGVGIVGPEGNVTIVAADALPTLMVGRSYAGESDGYAIFRISLSRAAASAVTLGLALAQERATPGVDYGTTLEVSADGNGGWTDAANLTFAAGVTQYYVRVAVIADNGVDGGGAATNVEGNESFTLTATVSGGAAALANGAAPVVGKGTIIDGASSVPYAWIDDLVVHEGSVAAPWIHRSSVPSGTTSVKYTTSDRTRLDIAVAATIDGGEGDDTIYGSNLGDNLFGGAGNDVLYGGRLDDWLLGGEGDDVLDAGTVDAGALGGDGNYLDGGAGNDVLRGREGSDWLEGGAGSDVLTGGAGDDVLAGGAGDGDDLKGGLGDDQYLVRLGDGADVGEDAAETGASGAPAVSGAGDYISQRFAGIAAGTIRRDWIGTSAGVVGTTVAGGEDAIVFGEGIDIGDIVLVRSATDSDDLIIRVMQTTGGTATFSGTQLTVKDWFSNPFKRVEWLKFAGGNDVRIGDITSFVVGGSGNDVLVGTAGNDFVYGGGGNDKLYLLAGNDIGNGGTGNDLVAGDTGRDLLLGGQGMDELIGGKGADVLSGDGEADDLYGGDDADILSGGRGDGDQVVGGGGNDTFKYARGDGRDTMFDDFTANWQAVWIDGNWNAAAGYAYIAATGEVTGPGGVYLRKNIGTAADPDVQWVGRFDYDSDSKTLRYFNPPAGTAIVANSGIDTIEFAPGIDIQDIVLSRTIGTNDITLSIAGENAEFATAASIGDSVTIKDWYALPGNIEKLAFYQTGVLDISAGVTNLIAGTDGADTTALNGTAGADWITGGAGDWPRRPHRSWMRCNAKAKISVDRSLIYFRKCQ